MSWETVIGLEVHAQLTTDSKIFSAASTAYGAAPNTQACAVDLGLPGVLPVINQRAIEMAAIFGLAIGATVAPLSIFARKNYFYPDLPKGYQISQFERPIVEHGSLDIETAAGAKTIPIVRAHLEEDAGKSVHGIEPGATGIDLNRAGTPLLEIVTAPAMSSAEEAVAYLRALHKLVRYLGICDGNMQEGSFRCDANVSVRPRGAETLGTRTETKNLNSFRFVEQAIAYEVERQIDVIESGGTVVQETRLYDPDADETRSMRSKEDAHDYRYFPDPDLLPVAVEPELLDKLRERLPELPQAKRRRYSSDYDLADDDADALTGDPQVAAYYEQVIAVDGIPARVAANWVLGELFGALNKHGVEIAEAAMEPAELACLIQRVEDGTLSNKGAKQVFGALWDKRGSVDEIIDAEGLRQVSDSGELEAIVDAVLAECAEQVEQYRGGKTKVLGFIIGQVMKRTQGRANPEMVNQMIRSRIDG